MIKKATKKNNDSLTLKVPEKFQLYGLYVYYVVHICDFGMLRVNMIPNTYTFSTKIISKKKKKILTVPFWYILYVARCHSCDLNIV